MGKIAGYVETYSALLNGIAEEADAIAIRYFRTAGLHVERKSDGTAVTPADRAVEEMARDKVAKSRLALDVLGEEMGGANLKSASKADRPRMIIDPIDGTEEFTRGIPTFGTLLAVEEGGEIVAAVVSAPGLRSRWWAYRGEGAFRDGKKLHVSNVDKLSDAMVFTTGTGPSKNAADQAKIRRLLDASRSSRSFGGFCNTCSSPRARSRRRSIGPRSPGISRRWESSWKRRAAAQQTRAAREPFTRGSSSAQTERFTTRF